MLLLRGATYRTDDITLRVSFNTCSSCEEQHAVAGSDGGRGGFNTCSSCEEQLEELISNAKELLFQYMLLLRGATAACAVHSPSKKFQYMLLLRGATVRSAGYDTDLSGFNTCSSCEEQLCQHPPFHEIKSFNTCSSCEEQLYQDTPKKTCGRFNTCSSCEEQPEGVYNEESNAQFQYMLLLRGATVPRWAFAAAIRFQYMLLLRGATTTASDQRCLHIVFQYMLLLRGATFPVKSASLFDRFNTCSSCEEQRSAPRHSSL